MTTETNKKMLERVRALLAKAESTTFPEEAESFRAKADEIMTRFAIDQWMVDQAQSGVGAVQAPERRDFNRDWRYSKFRHDLFHMFSELAEHCRCVIGYRGASLEELPVYGLHSDLDYLDMLYTQLSLEVAKNLQPPVDPSGEVCEQVFKQRQAGIGWAEITRKMYAAGLVEPTKANIAKYNLAEMIGDGDEPIHKVLDWDTIRRVNRPYGSQVNLGWYSGDLGDLGMELKNRLANANRRYVKEQGLEGERNYVKPEVYQRSFMMGFADEIGDRLRAMRAATQTAYSAENKANEFALAVRDVRSQALTLYNREFPQPPPVAPDPNAKKPKTRALKTREVTVSYAAMSAGRSKAREANLTNKPGQRIGSDSPRLGRCGARPRRGADNVRDVTESGGAVTLRPYSVRRRTVRLGDASVVMLLVTCPRADCGLSFLVSLIWGVVQPVAGRDGDAPAYPVGRSCPYCFRTAAVPERIRVRQPEPRRRVVRRSKA